MTPKSLAYLLVFLCIGLPCISQDSVSLDKKKLRGKLAKKDSAAEAVLNDAEQRYAQLGNSLRDKANIPGGRAHYIPCLDKLKTSLSFPDKNSNLLSQSKDVQQKITGSLNQVKYLQSSLQQTEQVKVFIRQRREQLKQALNPVYQITEEFLQQVYKELFFYSDAGCKVSGRK